MTALFNESDVGNWVSSLLMEKICLIRETLDAFPDRQENAQTKKIAMDKLEMMEWFIESVF